MYTYGNTQSRTKYINCVCVVYHTFMHAKLGEGAVGSKLAGHWKGGILPAG